jgi:hypothetical protein
VEIGLIFAEIGSSLGVIAKHAKSRSNSSQVAKKVCLRSSWYLPRRNLLCMQKKSAAKVGVRVPGTVPKTQAISTVLYVVVDTSDNSLSSSLLSKGICTVQYLPAGATVFYSSA